MKLKTLSPRILSDANVKAKSFNGSFLPETLVGNSDFFHEIFKEIFKFPKTLKKKKEEEEMGKSLSMEYNC
ncbi:unnamed protein product [Sphenostylis stenocarpa]|uniref:Uncharacterized protein n=1 Tax=Sphenostylis stenocarpa TaxID=92480 RepID=A0AA86W6G5_9FABA|nr:unnamed protein product [Sphenostylis stenocarpa]